MAAGSSFSSFPLPFSVPASEVINRPDPNDPSPSVLVGTLTLTWITPPGPQGPAPDTDTNTTFFFQSLNISVRLECGSTGTSREGCYNFVGGAANIKLHLFGPDQQAAFNAFLAPDAAGVCRPDPAAGALPVTFNITFDRLGVPFQVLPGFAIATVVLSPAQLQTVLGRVPGGSASLCGRPAKIVLSAPINGRVSCCDMHIMHMADACVCNGIPVVRDVMCPCSPAPALMPSIHSHATLTH